MSIGYYDEALKILREEINKELPDKSKLRIKLIFNGPFADLYNWYAKCLFDAGYHKEAIRVMNGGDFKSTVSDADELLALGDYSRKTMMMILRFSIIIVRKNISSDGFTKSKCQD